MSKIDYQALREAAEKATCGVWSLEYGEGRFDGDDALMILPSNSGHAAK